MYFGVRRQVPRRHHYRPVAKTLFQRVLYTLPVIWLVVSLVFLLIHLVPGDPIQQMLGEGAPAADIAAMEEACSQFERMGNIPDDARPAPAEEKSRSRRSTR